MPNHIVFNHCSLYMRLSKCWREVHNSLHLGLVEILLNSFTLQLHIDTHPLCCIEIAPELPLHLSPQLHALKWTSAAYSLCHTKAHRQYRVDCMHACNRRTLFQDPPVQGSKKGLYKTHKKPAMCI